MMFDPVHSPSTRNRATAPDDKVSALGEKRKSVAQQRPKRLETIDLPGGHD